MSRLEWWYPGCREKAERMTVDLTNVLHGRFLKYQLADETGRMHVPMWRDAQGASAQPGAAAGRKPGNGRARTGGPAFGECGE